MARQWAIIAARMRRVEERLHLLNNRNFLEQEVSSERLDSDDDGYASNRTLRHRALEYPWVQGNLTLDEQAQFTNNTHGWVWAWQGCHIRTQRHQRIRRRVKLFFEHGLHQ
eukprot:3747334-Alexandrium_andersonii.AAC.1